MSSANTVIIDPDEEQGDLDLELPDTQPFTVVDYNDNPKNTVVCHSQKSLASVRSKSFHSKFTRVSKKVDLQASDSVVCHELESCLLSDTDKVKC